MREQLSAVILDPDLESYPQEEQTSPERNEQDHQSPWGLREQKMTGPNKNRNLQPLVEPREGMLGELGSWRRGRFQRTHESICNRKCRSWHPPGPESSATRPAAVTGREGMSCSSLSPLLPSAQPALTQMGEENPINERTSMGGCDTLWDRTF